MEAMLAPCAKAAEPTIIYLVRHAEKAAEKGDPELTAQGQARARNLAQILNKTGIRQVFTTNTARTRQTAKPAPTSASTSTTACTS